jgi:hypothetical protein
MVLKQTLVLPSRTGHNSAMFAYFLAFSMVAGFQPMVQHRLSAMDFDISYHPWHRRWYVLTPPKKVSETTYQMMCLLVGTVDLAVIQDAVTENKLKCLSCMAFRLLSFHACRFVMTEGSSLTCSRIDIVWFDGASNATLPYLLKLAEQCRARKVSFSNLGIEDGCKFELTHASELEMFKIRKTTDKPVGELSVQLVVPNLTGVDIGPCEGVRVHVVRE